MRALDIAGGRPLAGQTVPSTVEGQIIVCLGDPVEAHPSGPPHEPDPVMADRSSRFHIDGVPACREGHLASCGHATTGRSWWTLPDCHDAGNDP